MQKFIIFLDIDGVFNSELFFRKREESKKNLRKDVKNRNIIGDDYYSRMLDKEAIDLFNCLVDELNDKFDTQIVLSSTWRNNPSVNDVLKTNGLRHEIISKTPNSEHRVRGLEIKQWLEDNITTEEYGCLYFDFKNYVIIDDDSDMLLNQAEHFFQTDNYTGLTPTTTYKIKRFAGFKQFQ